MTNNGIEMNTYQCGVQPIQSKLIQTNKQKNSIKRKLYNNNHCKQHFKNDIDNC